MTSPTKKTMWRNTSLKITALLFGYTFWYVFGQSHTSSAWITVPLCFYNVPKEVVIKGPETISLKIIAKRSDLRILYPDHFDKLAIHINAEELTQGKNLLTLTEQSILLPPQIKLVHYSPSNPTVELVPAAESLDG
jgi:hypothetical protein